MIVRNVLAELLASLPEDATLEECQEEFKLGCELCRSFDEVERGEVLSHEEAVAQLREALLVPTKIDQNG